MPTSLKLHRLLGSASQQIVLWRLIGAILAFWEKTQLMAFKIHHCITGLAKTSQILFLCALASAVLGAAPEWTQWKPIYGDPYGVAGGIDIRFRKQSFGVAGKLWEWEFRNRYDRRIVFRWKTQFQDGTSFATTGYLDGGKTGSGWNCDYDTKCQTQPPITVLCLADSKGCIDRGTMPRSAAPLHGTSAQLHPRTNPSLGTASDRVKENGKGDEYLEKSLPEFLEALLYEKVAALLAKQFGDIVNPFAKYYAPHFKVLALVGSVTHNATTLQLEIDRDARRLQELAFTLDRFLDSTPRKPQPPPSDLSFLNDRQKADGYRQQIDSYLRGTRLVVSTLRDFDRQTTEALQRTDASLRLLQARLQEDLGKGAAASLQHAYDKHLLDDIDAVRIQQLRVLEIRRAAARDRIVAYNRALGYR